MLPSFFAASSGSKLFISKTGAFFFRGGRTSVFNLVLLIPVNNPASVSSGLFFLRGRTISEVDRLFVLFVPSILKVEQIRENWKHFHLLAGLTGLTVLGGTAFLK